jgi:hypothetical protein
MIARHVVDLSSAIPENAPVRVQVGGATGFQFLEVPSPIWVRIDSQGARFPLSAPREIQLCSYKATELIIDNNGEGGTGELELLAYHAGEAMSPKASASAIGLARLIGQWQGAHGTGPLDLLDTSNPSDYNTTGATQHYGYKAALGGWCQEVSLPANVTPDQWAHSFAPKSTVDIMHFVDPLYTASIAAQVAGAAAYRLDLPVNVTALVNNGVVGSGVECRVHAGFMHTENGMAGGVWWPGPGIFYVTNAATGTWKAVIAGYNAGNVAPNDRIEYWAQDTGISYLAPHLLTVVAGLQDTGDPCIQFAIDGALLFERLARYVVGAFDPPTNYGSGTAVQFQYYTSPGVSSFKNLGDSLETVVYQTFFGPGWKLYRREGVLAPGVLLGVGS